LLIRHGMKASGGRRDQLYRRGHSPSAARRLNATLAQLGKVFVSPGPTTNRKGAAAIGGARTSPLSQRDSVRATWRSTPSPTTSRRRARCSNGALALGCTVVPTGTGQTEMQAATIADLRASRLYRHAFVPELIGREGRRVEG